MTTYTSLAGAGQHYRTWQFQVSQAVAAQATVALTNARGLRMIKDSFTGAGAWTDNANGATASTNNWSVESSCNGPTGTSGGAANQFGNNDSVDRWANDVDVGWANAGSNHSWIVLKQTGLAGTIYLCIDCVGTSTQNATFVFSRNQFTGGTATARPTSVNEVTVNGAGPTAWGGPSSNAASVLHVQKSADGQATRVLMHRNNWCTALWVIDALENAPPSSVNPYVGAVYGSTTAAPASSIAVQNSYSNSGVISHVTHVNANPALCLFNLLYYNTNQSTVTVPTVQNDMAVAWRASRVKVHTRYNVSLSTTVPITDGRGSHGQIRDLWWVQSQLGETDYAPSGGGRNYIIAGDFALPWNTTAATTA